MTERITIHVYYDDGCPCETATVEADLSYGGITTHGCGSPNITHYTATVAGYELAATWDDDARHDTTVTIERSHPLAEAVVLVGRMQDARDTYREACSKRPSSYTSNEWAEVRAESRRKWAEAKREVMDHPLAARLAGRETVEA